MEGFIKFINALIGRFPLHVEIGYNKTCDWNIYIYKKGCAMDYSNSECDGDNAVLCNIQDCDVELAFAKAQCEVKKWLREHEGGY